MLRNLRSSICIYIGFSLWLCHCRIWKIGRKPVSKKQKERNLEKRRRRSRIAPRNTLSAVNLEKTFKNITKEVALKHIAPSIIDSLEKKSLVKHETIFDVSKNTENAPSMTIEQLDKLNEEHLFSAVTEDMKINIYLKCKGCFNWKKYAFEDLRCMRFLEKRSRMCQRKFKQFFIIDVEVA